MMDSPAQLEKWIIPHFSSICDEVCSKTISYDDFDIELSAKNFKYLYFPFNINIKMKYNYAVKKKKKIKAKLTFIIYNTIRSRNLIITETAIFRSPDYEYTLKTRLTQDKLCNPQAGWVNSDCIKIKFKIEFIKLRYYHFETEQYDEEESSSENSIYPGEESSSDNEYDEIIDKNYYDFLIYDYNNEKSQTLKFSNFEMNLSSGFEKDKFAIFFSFCTNQRFSIFFTFKLINFNYPPKESPMKRKSIKSNPNGNYYYKQETIYFPLTYEEITDDQEGWLKDNQYMQLHINFYYPKSKEDILLISRQKGNYNTHFSRNYSYNYNYNNNSISYGSSIYHDNSKAETGCVGLQNQGATCYMNSLLQSLFHIPAFRKIVYQMPISDQEDLKTSIPLCLQRLFAKLQFNDESCSTKELTTSFGWNDHETFIQHDVQEFCTVLISKLSDKMKGTPLENSLSLLLGGKFKSYIRCINVDFESSKTEEFFDLSMVVKGALNLEQSFKIYVETEQLNGDNQYKTDQYGPQDAIMGTEFIQFPPVLHIHLRRFQFDYQTMRMAKINDRFEFPLTIDLKPYMVNEQNQENQTQNNENQDPSQNQIIENQNPIQDQIIENRDPNQTQNDEKQDHIQNETIENQEESQTQSNENQSQIQSTANQVPDQNEITEDNESTKADPSIRIDEERDNSYLYDLYGVLVHSGSISGGHYFAFLRTSTSPQWFKFNDSSVTKATLNEAVEDNFGGSSNGYYSEKSYSAYMLVYIRRNEASEIMKPVSEDEVPDYLVRYAKGESIESNDKDGVGQENKKEGEAKSADENKMIKIDLYEELCVVVNSILGKPGFAANNSNLKKTITLPFIFNQQQEEQQDQNDQQQDHQLNQQQDDENLNQKQEEYLDHQLNQQQEDENLNQQQKEYLDQKQEDENLDQEKDHLDHQLNQQNLNENQLLPIQLNHKIIYDEIAKIKGIDRSNIRLWMFQNSPYSVFRDDDTIVNNDLSLFIQYKSSDLSVDITSSSEQGARNVIFMKFFHPNLIFPFNYIGSTEINKETPINEGVFPLVREKLGLSEEQELQVFHEYPNYYQKLNPNDPCRLMIQILVFQLDPGQFLPETCPFHFLTLDEVINENMIQNCDEKTLNEFEIQHGIKLNENGDGFVAETNIFDYNLMMGISSLQTATDFYSSKKELIYMNLFDYNALFVQTPFARISFQPSISLSDLKSFIARIIRLMNDINYGCKDSDYFPLLNSIQIYKPVNKSLFCHEPMDKPIVHQQSIPNLSYEFRNMSSYYDKLSCQNLFVQLNLGIPEVVVEKEMVSVMVLFAPDGFLISKFKVFQFIGANDDGSKIGASCLEIIQMLLSDDYDDLNVITIRKNDILDENQDSFDDDQNQNLIVNDQNENKNENLVDNQNQNETSFVDDQNQNLIANDHNENENLIANDHNENEILIADNHNENLIVDGHGENKPSMVDGNDSGIGEIIDDGGSSNAIDKSNQNGDGSNGADSGNLVVFNSNEANQQNEADRSAYSHEIILPDDIAGIPVNRIRISQIKGNVIRKLLSLDSQINENAIIRFDVMSEENVEALENGASLVPVSFINEDDMIAYGNPFLIVVSEDEKFESVKKKLNDYLVGNELITNQDFMHLSFYFGDPQQPGLQKKMLWKDMNVLSEMRSKLSYANNNVVLFIMHKTKKNNDMSVKIYN